MIKKNRFIGYTPDQVFESEAVSYIVIAGNDLLEHKGMLVFTKKAAAKHYNNIYREMLKILQFGTKTEKKKARIVIEKLKVEPLRVH
jgi:hypothetical protein